MVRPVPWSLVVALTLGATSCAVPCPKPCSSGEEKLAWERDLDARRPLRVDPEWPISEKIDVRRFHVSVDAPTFARAFERVMIDPNVNFDAIRIDRKRENLGKPFRVGEKFQGRYQMAKVSDLVSLLPADWVCGLENDLFSDYGMVARLNLDPPPGEPFELEYVYIEGSPIAGSSLFRIEAAGARQARFTQVFRYQEADRHTERLMKALVLRMHNRVVFNEVYLAARAAGGEVLCTNVEPEDQVFPEGCASCTGAVPTCSG